MTHVCCYTPIRGVSVIRLETTLTVHLISAIIKHQTNSLMTVMCNRMIDNIWLINSVCRVI